MFKNKYAIAVVLASIFLISSCTKVVERSELEKLIQSKQFEPLMDLVDVYITENEEDDFGYYVKAIALMNLDGESSDILSVLDTAFLKSPEDKIANYSFSMSVMLLQNGYCDESLPIASKMGFNLDDAESREFYLLGTGYVDCISQKNSKSKKFVITLYEKLFVLTRYNHELTQSYITYLAKIDRLDKAEHVLYRYGLHKPKSRTLSDLLIHLKTENGKANTRE
ncbi:hypothetical protein [Vibrio sp. 99-70-13A1]|uniref:hypothetical protein n=1 Tax=Vibrio sp. 99-70-13A1 TaxID=2607601 RepID=UPI001493692B|nr:hypothetical protein [Vibrio sp. 99-70-13A1]NOH99395.1 hypothetical protein [Vibrio sp. 99-70-13A1]